MEQSPSWEANRFSAGQEIPSILWSLKFHYRFYKWYPPVPIPAPRDPFQAPPPRSTSWRSTLMLSSHLRFEFSSSIFALIYLILSSKILKLHYEYISNKRIKQDN
jgi:hypothetical protein